MSSTYTHILFSVPRANRDLTRDYGDTDLPAKNCVYWVSGMSQNLKQLCTLVIEDIYGAFYSHIFSTLASDGRLTIAQVAERSHLPQRQARYGLSVLVQLHLVYHHSISGSPTFYQANTRNAYYLLRSGLVISLVEHSHGLGAASIVTQLLHDGHSSVRYLKRNLASCSTNSMGRQDEADKRYENGRFPASSAGLDQDNNSMRDVDSLLQKLAMDGWILRVREAHFRTYADNLHDAELTVRGSNVLAALRGRKAQEEFARMVEQEISQRVKAGVNVHTFSKSSNSGFKRGHEDDSYEIGNKKARLANGETPQVIDNMMVREDIDDSLVVRVNFDKVAVLLRNQYLVSLAAQRVGKSAARTYACLLKQFEGRQYKGQDDAELVPEAEETTADFSEIDTDRLLLAVNADHDLATHTIAADQHSRHASQEAPAKPYTNGHLNGDSVHAEPVDAVEVEADLRALAEAPYELVSRDPDTLKWTVDFKELAIQMRNQEVFNVVKALHGVVAVRILRILLEHGKTDEKFLQEIALLSAKDLRQMLARLKAAGFIELQEVPREPQRQPSRTMYLWFYDADRVRRMLLDDTYKCQARCFQRMDIEKRKIRSTLEKAERTDVKGNEEDLLPQAELDVLLKWNRTEAFLLGEIGRLDDFVAVFRDF